MNALKLTCLLVVFPLLLAALGGWELQRADRAATALVELRLNLANYKEPLQAVAARQPASAIPPPEGLITVQEAIARVEKTEAELPTAHRINRVLHALAPWVIGLGLLAAFIGLAALAGTYWAGRRAQQSREKLLQVFTLGSRLLPYVLVGHVVAMGVYSASLMAGGGLAALLSPVVATHFQQWQAGLGVWLLPALGALLLWAWLPLGAPRNPHMAPAFKGLRNRRAWLLALYFGLVNCGYMSMVAWLPAYYQQLGWGVLPSGSPNRNTAPAATRDDCAGL